MIGAFARARGCFGGFIARQPASSLGSIVTKGFVWRLVVGHAPTFDAGILEHPSLRFVYELALRRVRDFNPAAAAISAVIRPTVRDLDIGVRPSGEEQEVTLNLEPLWDALPRLQRIKLRNVFVRVGIDEAPLKTLEHDGTTMHAATGLQPAIDALAARVRPLLGSVWLGWSARPPIPRSHAIATTSACSTSCGERCPRCRWSTSTGSTSRSVASTSPSCTR